MSIRQSFWLLVMLNTLDAILTTILVGSLGAVEVNPIIAASIHTFGFIGIYLVKGPVLALLGYLIYKQTKGLTSFSLLICNIAYIIVNGWSIYLITYYG